MECWREPGCRAETDRQDALKVALNFGLQFQVLDFRTAYKDQVMSYFLAQYQAGLTPNPDVVCNREIKFGLFYDWALANGLTIATGHYAQILPITTAPTKTLGLFTATDTHKDQTYFLHQLKPPQLDQILFPIGHLTKTQVRQAALEWQLPVANKPDSVGICFVGEINVKKFLQEKLGTNPGPIVDITGKTIGQHAGLWFYTIGQRHGFKIDPKKFLANHPEAFLNQQLLPPLYVIAKQASNNSLVVDLQLEQSRVEFKVSQLKWLEAPQVDTKLLVRIRHTGELVPCQLVITGPTGTGSILLEKSLQGISAGQFAVFYRMALLATQPHQCLGGGVIEA
jgi:tRNA-specific 2-thiouridylase